MNNSYFETSQYFSSTVANFFTTNGVETLPSNWSGSWGDANLANAIANTADSIGYVETADALAISLQFANVNGMSPVINFGTPLTVTSSDLVYNEVISTTNNTNGTPVPEPISTVPGVTAPSSTSRCIALVPPADYAVPGSKESAFLPPYTYPIVAISYLLGNTNGNGMDVVNTQNLLTAPYNATIKDSVTTIGPRTGFAFLNLGAGTVTASQIAACLAY